MESIRISSANEVRLMINDDPNRVIEFDPSDLEFIESFYNLIETFEKKEKDFKKRDAVLRANKDKDKYGMPKNAKARIALNREVCNFIKEQIDVLFGEGTSEKAFGNKNNLEMIVALFDGVTPFIQNKRKEMTSKYIAAAESTDAEVME